MGGAPQLCTGALELSCAAALSARAKSSAAAQLPLADSSDFYVSNFNGDAVAVYDETGAYLRSFTAPGLNGPRGVVWTPDG